MVGRLRPNLVAVGDKLQSAVAIDICLYPVELQKSMVCMIEDHSPQLAIEPLDDPLGSRPRPPDCEIQRSHDQRRCAHLETVARLLRIIADDVLDDELVHQ